MARLPVIAAPTTCNAAKYGNIAVLLCTFGFTAPVPAIAAPSATAGHCIRATIGWGLVNPKKPGTLAAQRFALYQPGQSVGAYVQACVAAGHSRRNATADLAWDTKHGFVLVG